MKLKIIKSIKNIIFEKEAYKMEGIPDYLSNRKPYSFLKYGSFKQ